MRTQEVGFLALWLIRVIRVIWGIYMSCEFCVGKFFKHKLGRCKQCMGINLLLLIAAISSYLYIDISNWLAVQQVALLMFIGSTAILMVLHVAAWCFYRLKGNNNL